jgi:uncharacterized protein YecT (DUF1311 family)
MRLAISFLLFVFLSPVQNSGPAGSTAPQSNPCDSAKTQQEMTQCSGEQYRKADNRLNAVYAKAIRELQKRIVTAEQNNDADRKKHNEVALQKLRAAERSWIQYRNLHCDASRQQNEGGSISSMVWANCMKEATEQRIEALKHAYESGDTKL